MNTVLLVLSAETLHRVGERHAGVHERGEHAAEALDAR